MKQHITPKQFKQLSDEQQKKLIEWWTPQEGDQAVCQYGVFTVHKKDNADEMIWCDCGYSLPPSDPFPLVSIGQMIQFIQEKKPLLKSISKARFDKWIVNIETATLGYKDELCDALWEATTRVLKDVE
jgi:hypothetical protein